ncbi:hypothetical protein ZWY2020_058205 [Hordeum vulgare]|nr:hypothetical protein ZWY2020_058205 [Hordeum vulgare]
MTHAVLEAPALEASPARIEQRREPTLEQAPEMEASLAIVPEVVEEGLVSPTTEPSCQPKPRAMGGDDRALVVSLVRRSPHASRASSSGPIRMVVDVC